MECHIWWKTLVFRPLSLSLIASWWKWTAMRHAIIVLKYLLLKNALRDKVMLEQCNEVWRFWVFFWCCPLPSCHKWKHGRFQLAGILHILQPPPWFEIMSNHRMTGFIMSLLEISKASGLLHTVHAPSTCLEFTDESIECPQQQLGLNLKSVSWMWIILCHGYLGQIWWLSW